MSPTRRASSRRFRGRAIVSWLRPTRPPAWPVRQSTPPPLPARRSRLPAPPRRLPAVRLGLLACPALRSGAARGRVVGDAPSATPTARRSHVHHRPVRRAGTCDPSTFAALARRPLRCVHGVGPEATRALWLRPLAESAARSSCPTGNPLSPFWSPDGSRIGFFQPGSLRRCRSPSVDTGAVGAVAAVDAQGRDGFCPSSMCPIRCWAPRRPGWTMATSSSAGCMAEASNG